MNSPLNENLMTTKDASELSGYTSDYLSRLVRSGEITGDMIGHSWLIERSSLERFLEKQKSRKTDRSRELANERAEEYRKHHQAIQRTTRYLTARFPVMNESEPGAQEPSIWQPTLRSHMLALSTALVVVISGATLARADVLPALAGRIAIVAQEASAGFGDTFGAMPASLTVGIGAADAGMRASASRVAAAQDAYQSASPLAAVDAASLASVFVKDYHSSSTTVAAAPALLASVSPMTATDMYASVLDAYAFVTTPLRLALAAQHAYIALGAEAYAGITASFSAYRSLIDHAGAATLASVITTRDTLAAAPRAVRDADIALGDAVIGAAHAAIHADVSASYGIAAAAPASARATVAFIGATGSVLAGATARVPALATAAYLRATAVPVALAPALARSVFGAEYALATRFVGATGALSERYLALVEGTGRVAYQGAEGSIAFAQTLEHAPAAIEDAYLGALGKSALALGAVAPSSSLAAVALAAQPALSAGEQAALAVYQTVHSLFDSTTNALATLFGPTTPATVTPPSAALPSATSTPALALATSTPVGAAPAVRQTVNTYPTYTTVVQGVSQDALARALASLRSDILSTTAGMIQPVAAQGATNATTIQYVNMIQDLSNLTVHNGTFDGGTFTGGTLSNGASVAATNGTFTSLTAGATSLATTTITGNATVTGSLTIGTTTITGSLTASGPSSLGATVTAGAFVATSSEATSTFAGSLAIDTNGFVYATSTKDVGIGVLSPAALLAIRNSTSTQPIFTASSAAGTEVYRITDAGFVGIGTTTPLSRLAISGGATIGADYNVAAPANSLLVEGS
ncbi:MAG TPA: helix-turn-helix domain-containing protein, partial [Candidatus Paceibacterota bacterium]|nr:helix-turn-helix domain-containing protein [Candidatus Paceibacterota bacterium]